MKWTTTLVLTHRIYARQLQDPKLAFDQMTDDLQMMFNVRLHIGEVEEQYWPIYSEDVDALAKKGYFIATIRRKPHLLVRELKYKVICDDLKQSETFVEQINEKFDKKFAGIEIIKSFLTEIQAV